MTLWVDGCTGAVGGVHLLPVYPSSGDGGFAPLRYDQVDPHFGDWADVEAIAKTYDLMLELMVNHISPASEQFQDFLERGDESPHASMFIDWDKFWGEGEAPRAVTSMLAPRAVLLLVRSEA